MHETPLPFPAYDAPTLPVWRTAAGRPANGAESAEAGRRAGLEDRLDSWALLDRWPREN